MFGVDNSELFFGIRKGCSGSRRDQDVCPRAPSSSAYRCHRRARTQGTLRSFRPCVLRAPSAAAACDGGSGDQTDDAGSGTSGSQGQRRPTSRWSSAKGLPSASRKVSTWPTMTTLRRARVPPSLKSICLICRQIGGFQQNIPAFLSSRGTLDFIDAA